MTTTKPTTRRIKVRDLFPHRVVGDPAPFRHGEGYITDIGGLVWPADDPDGGRIVGLSWVDVGGSRLCRSAVDRRWRAMFGPDMCNAGEFVDLVHERRAWPDIDHRACTDCCRLGRQAIAACDLRAFG